MCDAGQYFQGVTVVSMSYPHMMQISVERMPVSPWSAGIADTWGERKSTTAAARSSATGLTLLDSRASLYPARRPLTARRRWISDVGFPSLPMT